MPQPHLTHHLTDDLVYRYAAGMLDEAVSLVVAAHLALCADCRRLTAEAELLGGNLLEDLPADSLADDSWARTLSRLNDNQPQTGGLAPAAASPARPMEAPTPGSDDNLDPMFPEPLRAYLADRLTPASWRRLGPGIRDLELVRGSSGSKARLLHIGAGRSVFEHSHRGMELTLVLQGSYLSNGTRFARGDVECADDETTHRPVAGTEADCICLAVTDAPLRFNNLIGRLLQPLIGI
jgi:putative transcriptional regulator